MIARRFAFLALALLLGTVFSTAFAAHNGNNSASFDSYDGRAIVNYRNGSGTFNGSISVSGLEPGAGYMFTVALNGANETFICGGEANSGGVFSCSATDLALPGFNMAILSGSGIGESATFDRRGNCRDPNQGGTQCEAPGHTAP